MEGTRIQISIRLLEKLAGVAPEPQPPAQRRQQQQRCALGDAERLTSEHVGLPALPGLPRVPLLPERPAPAAALDHDVQGALAASRRVGALLLKAEDRELGAVGAAADEMLARERSTPAREAPCRAAEAAVVDCYQRNRAEAWRCASLVDAYAACSAAAFDSLAA